MPASLWVQHKNHGVLLQTCCNTCFGAATTVLPSLEMTKLMWSGWIWSMAKEHKRAREFSLCSTPYGGPLPSRKAMSTQIFNQPPTSAMIARMGTPCSSVHSSKSNVVSRSAGFLRTAPWCPLKHTLAVDFGKVRATLWQATGNGGVLLQPSTHEGVIKFVQREVAR